MHYIHLRPQLTKFFIMFRDFYFLQTSSLLWSVCVYLSPNNFLKSSNKSYSVELNRVLTKKYQVHSLCRLLIKILTNWTIDENHTIINCFWQKIWNWVISINIFCCIISSSSSITVSVLVNYSTIFYYMYVFKISSSISSSSSITVFVWTAIYRENCKE